MRSIVATDQRSAYPRGVYSTLHLEILEYKRTAILDKKYQSTHENCQTEVPIEQKKCQLTFQFVRSAGSIVFEAEKIC